MKTTADFSGILPWQFCRSVWAWSGFWQGGQPQSGPAHGECSGPQAAGSATPDLNEWMMTNEWKCISRIQNFHTKPCVFTAPDTHSVYTCKLLQAKNYRRTLIPIKYKLPRPTHPFPKVQIYIKCTSWKGSSSVTGLLCLVNGAGSSQERYSTAIAKLSWYHVVHVEQSNSLMWSPMKNNDKTLLRTGVLFHPGGRLLARSSLLQECTCEFYYNYALVLKSDVNNCCLDAVSPKQK